MFLLSSSEGNAPTLPLCCSPPQYKIQLVQLEDDLLERLANAPDDILSDVPLIEGLEATKVTNSMYTAVLHPPSEWTTPKAPKAVDPNVSNRQPLRQAYRTVVDRTKHSRIFVGIVFVKIAKKLLYLHAVSYNTAHVT